MDQKPDQPDDGDLPISEDERRQLTMENIVVLKALRAIAEQARRDRHKQTTVILTVVSAIFLVRQFLPPAWMVWLPL